MFHPPSGLAPSTEQFLSLTDAKTIIEDINTILSETGFNPRPSNPCFLIAILSSFAFAGAFPAIMMSGTTGRVGGYVTTLCIALFLPYIVFFGLVQHYKSQRKRRLLQYVDEWNRWALYGQRFLSFSGNHSEILNDSDQS